MHLAAGNKSAKTIALSPQDRAFLISMLAQMQAAYAGRVDGDANVGNVQVDYHGDPVVIDLDGFAVGPREWGPGADRHLLRQLRPAHL